MSDALARFSAGYIPEPNSGCWLWLGGLGTTGYGTLSINNRHEGAHRFSYQHFVGPIPAGHDIDHKCRVRCCVNPDHLRPLSRAENVLAGDGHAALNARKTHCHKGHEYTPENTVNSIGRNGKSWRKCLACIRSKNNGRGKGHHAEKTHCPRGHPYSPENTFVRRGSRNCRTCVNYLQNLRRYLRKRAA